jgi:hypothetical protein
MAPMWELLGSHWLFSGQMIFTVAMLLHVYRTSAEPFWYFVIFFLQPVGVWVYFLLLAYRTFCM